MWNKAPFSVIHATKHIHFKTSFLTTQIKVVVPQSLSGTGQKVNILRFAGHMVSVETAELYHSCMKTAADNTETNEQGCDPIKLYLSR